MVICKYLYYGYLFEGSHAENLQNSVETEVQTESLLDYGYKHIHRDRYPDLGLHRILRGTVKRFDSRVLLDPSEKQFDLPAAFVELRDGESRNDEAVRQES